ncbi:MAG TPA: hypothetical protein VFT91_02815 [Dehalococcoidia bacterium]|nr:hypothetical protein [Dehalococcoidia bacterium]
MKRLVFLGAAAALAAAALACGGGGGGPGQTAAGSRLVLRVDLSRLAAGSDETVAIGVVRDAVRQRLDAYGVGPATIERQGADQLLVTLGHPISEDEARELLEKRATLELRQPVRDTDGLIVCEAQGGGRFSVAPEKITYVRSGTGALPACVGEGQSGLVQWEPAVPAGPGGAPPPAVVPISATVDRTQGPVLVLKFTPENGDLIHKITDGLVGLPLGIFLNGELVAGPTLSGPVTTANLAIPGLSLHEASIVAAQFNGGELLVPVTVVSVEAQ